MYLLAVVWASGLMLARRKQAAETVAADRSLSGSETLQVWLVSLLNPLFSGAIFYFGWRSPLPTMAREANRISMYAFFIEMMPYLIFVFLLSRPS